MLIDSLPAAITAAQNDRAWVHEVLNPVILRSAATKDLRSMGKGYVYILTNKNNRVLYTGVTGDLLKRMYEHRNKMVVGFTEKYNVSKLVYYEISDDMGSAISREKQIKGWVRSKKIALIEEFNPQWKDLYDSIL